MVAEIHLRIYWDHATVLRQAGLLADSAAALPDSALLLREATSAA